MPPRVDISRMLKDDVRLARIAYENAHADFKMVTAEIPSGLPSPDGVHRIRNAANSYRSALDDYQERLRDLDGFLRNGLIPPRVKNRGKTQ